MHQPLKTMMKGAVLLSIAAFITKVLSAVYRVPFQNMVGNTGFYVYQQVYPLYGIGMTFALSGFPVFLSNVVAEQHYIGLKKLLWHSFMIMAALGGACFFFLYYFAHMIATYMGDGQLAEVIQAVSWMFLMMPFLVVMRGYFQGTFRMLPTAVSQVVEQLVRISMILFVASLYASQQVSLYQMGQWAMFSATVAAIVAIITLFGALLYERYQKKRHNVKRVGVTTVYDTHELEQVINNDALGWKMLLKRFLLEGGTICLLASMLVFYQLIDSFTLFNQLVSIAIPEEMAKNLKGIYDRGQPLVQLGMVVGVGFSASYMPMMTKAFFNQRWLELQKSASSLLRMTMAFAASATVGIIAVLPRLNHMLFGDTAGSNVLAVYILSIWIASMIMAYHGALQSMRHYRITLGALLCGLIVKYGANVLLIPLLETMGASVATVLGLSCMLGIIYLQAPTVLKQLVRQNRYVTKLVAGLLLMFSMVKGFDRLVAIVWQEGASRTADSLVTLVMVVIGALVFSVYAMNVQLFTLREWVLLPKGKTILRLFKQKRKDE